MTIYTLTFVALLVLKLANLATISWWLVFMPLAVYIVIVLLFLLISGATR